MTTPGSVGTITRVVTEVVVEGHVTAQNAHELKQAIIDALESHLRVERWPADIEVNLELAGTVCSAGITALVSGARHCQANGKELFLSHATPEFREVLKQVGIEGAFTFAEDLPQ